MTLNYAYQALLIEEIKSLKAAGASQLDAAEYIHSLARNNTEFFEEILDVLDLVTGFCHPSKRIWSDEI